MKEHLPSPQEQDPQEDIWKEAEEYYALANEKMTPEASTSLRHIIGNLSAILHPNYKEIIIENNPALKNDVRENISYIKRYLHLLERFPAFREKEEGGGDGYFPDLVKRNIGSRELIENYEKLL